MDVDRYCIKCKKYSSYYNYSNNLPEYCVNCKETAQKYLIKSIHLKIKFVGLFKKHKLNE